MARHGENIRKRKDGRWEGRYAVYSEEKGKKIYCSVYGKSYLEVKEKLNAEKRFSDGAPQREAEASPANNAPSPEKFLFANAAGEWLGEVKKKKKNSTYVKYSIIYRKYLEQPFQDTSLCEMTDSLVKSRLSMPPSHSTVSSIYCVLNQILKFASLRYSIVLPVQNKPTAHMRSKPIEVLTKKEQEKLFFVLYREMDLFKMSVLLCLYTGLRLGEACALKWEDIDFKNGIISVNRTVQRIAVEGYETKTILSETEPKSGYSKRQIPLPSPILELLGSFQTHQEYIFGGKKALEPRTMQYRFKKILKEAGLPDKNFHILRHTFATNCIEGGTDVKSLSEMLGHSDVGITLNRYVHPSMDTKRRHLDILSAFYGQIHGQAS